MKYQTWIGNTLTLYHSFLNLISKATHLIL